MSDPLITDVAFAEEAALQYLFGSLLDVVGVYNGFDQVYLNARPLKASLRETSRIMEHPAETGVVLADHHIINPVEIGIPLIIPAQFYAGTYQQIKADFLAPTLLTVKTPVAVYDNMVIADMPHEEDPEHFNVITLFLHLRQILYFVPGAAQALPANYSPAEPDNQDTVQNGLQQPVESLQTLSGNMGPVGAW
jgi:hypothetical protein